MYASLVLSLRTRPTADLTCTQDIAAPAAYHLDVELSDAEYALLSLHSAFAAYLLVEGDTCMSQAVVCVPS